ncbi:MAG: hypothetical protein ACOYLT_06445 [Flavobacterium sp.]|jgi:hypothetical protein|uniref:hypothetical protein n=1 Tax=Flavobacterium sp. TaxID=239 RepID=UPI003BE91E88
MKKIILTVAGVFALSFANAQSYTKPDAGDMQLEVTFTPNLSSDAMFANPTFYGTEAAGIRLRKFSSATKALRLTGHLSYNDSGVDGTESAMALAASVGIENHMKGTDRLSTFWGYEGTLLYAKDELKTTTIGVGAQLFTGCDYYIMPNVYLGAEVNFGLSVASTKPDAGDGVTSISLNPGINPNLRLGWRF